MGRMGQIGPMADLHPPTAFFVWPNMQAALQGRGKIVSSSLPMNDYGRKASLGTA